MNKLIMIGIISSIGLYYYCFNFYNFFIPPALNKPIIVEKDKVDKIVEVDKILEKDKVDKILEKDKVYKILEKDKLVEKKEEKIVQTVIPIIFPKIITKPKIKITFSEEINYIQLYKKTDDKLILYKKPVPIYELYLKGDWEFI